MIAVSPGLAEEPRTHAPSLFLQLTSHSSTNAKSQDLDKRCESIFSSSAWVVSRSMDGPFCTFRSRYVNQLILHACTYCWAAATRKPRNLYRESGVSQIRYADRQWRGSPHQPPPRNTRSAAQLATAGPSGSVSGEEL